MPIRYLPDSRAFFLSGGDVSYVLYVDEKGTLLNLYWGKRVPDGSVSFEAAAYPDGASFDLAANRLPYELPVRGSGWYGTPAVSAINAHGDDVVVLKYAGHRQYAGKHPLNGLPATYVEQDDEASSLEIDLVDPLTKLCVTAVYSIYEKTGALTRSLRLTNEGENALVLNGAMAASAPLYGRDYELIHLKGAWARERSIVRTPVGQGEYRVFSQRGASSHEENPFVALCTPSATEHTGEVWAMNLVYSGSFLATAFVDNNDNTRLSIGMNPDTFSWQLEPGETFTTPEAVLVYSDAGLNGMSHVYHRLYRTRLARGSWRDRVRPILVNNWEATYFDFNAEKILAIARRARDLGIELFVLDDGWFGHRDIDNCSLGDWVVDRRKLPDGITGLVEQINALGLKFGLWFEPEMVSPDSDLYRAHPDWCLHVDGRARTEARNQLILDLSRTEVQDYIIEAVSAVLRSANIEYVKWDMNRNMTEHFSGDQRPERQRETQHRYILGLYRVLETITSRFPNVLFESCSGGGGRFDAGMLYYMPQTWTSDDTDAVERLSIQYGTSLAYPCCAMGAHVSAVPNHQTGRTTRMQMRGDVAIGGNFGFELDLSTLSDEDTATARRLVEQVKSIRELTQKGEFTRLLSPFEGPHTAWQFVSENGSEALLCVYGALLKPNMPPFRVRMCGLDANASYIDDDGIVCNGAALMNMGLWIHLPGDFSSKIVHLKKI